MKLMPFATRIGSMSSLLVQFISIGCTTSPRLSGTVTKSTVSGGAIENIKVGSKIEVKKTSKNSYGFYIEASVNGKSRRFRLDSGSVCTSVSSDSDTVGLASLGVKAIASVGGHSVVFDHVKIERFHLSGDSDRPMPALRCAGGSEPDTIGLDVFDGQIWSLNFSNFVSSILKSEEVSKLRKAKMFALFRGPQRHILVPLRVGGSQIAAAFDTGTAVTAFDRSYVLAHSNQFKPIESSSTQIGDGTNQSIAVSYFEVESLKIGAADFGKQVVTAFLFPPDLKKAIGASVIVGSNTMYLADWTFDLKHNRFTARNSSRR